MNENNDTTKNMFLAMGASAIILILWSMFFGPQPELEKKTEDKKAENVLTKAKTKTTITETKEKKDLKAENSIVKVDYNQEEKIATLETSKFKATFSTYGASVKHYSLKGKKYTTDKEKKKSIVLINNDKDFPAYSITMKQENKQLFPANLPFTIESKDDKKIVFVFSDNKFKITKTYTITDIDYLLHLYVKIENLTSSEQIFSTSMKFSTIYDERQERTNPFGKSGKAHIYKSVDNDFERIDDEYKKKVVKNLQFAGIDDRYFASFIKISKKDIYTFTPSKIKLKKEKLEKVRFTLDSEPLKVVANGSIELSYDIFNGPKITSILKQVGAENIIDYGFVAVVAKLIHWLIVFLYSLIGNFGFALILLTLLVKIVLYPLTKSSYISMHKMKTLKPQLDKLKEKYGKDREKIGRETMALYKKEGVSPLGGCLPMLLQMPIWFGLYRAIQYSVELYNEPFFLWIQDLSMKDPYYVLPITMGILMFFQQKMSSATMDQMQAKIMLYTMPILFSFFMIMLPAGLVLYIWTNTLVSILQQKYINNKLDKEDASKGKGNKSDKKDSKIKKKATA